MRRSWHPPSPTRTFSWKEIDLDKSLKRAGAIWGIEAIEEEGFEGETRRLMVLDISRRQREEFVIKSLTYEWLLKLANRTVYWRSTMIQMTGSISLGDSEVGTFSAGTNVQAEVFLEGELSLGGAELKWKPAGGGVGFYDAEDRLIVRTSPAWRDSDRRKKILFHSEMHPAAQEVEDALHLAGLLAIFDRLHAQFRDPYGVGTSRWIKKWVRW